MRPFVWDTQKAGLLTSQTGNGASTRYTYDSAGRVTDTTVTLPGLIGSFVTSTLYDGNLGRPKAMVYPTQAAGGERLTVAYQYNTTGYLTHEKNAATGFVYREVTAQDALGNITQAKLNNLTLTGNYHYHHISGQMLSTQAGTAHHIRYENGSTKGYDSYGNLTYQTNVFSGASESYTYDNLHRLTQSVVNYTGGNATIDYAYDAVGNFKKKTDYSANSDTAYQYATGSNKISSVALKDNGGTVTFGYDASGNQTHRNGSQEISYNAFNKPTTITKNGQNITLSYGPDIMRYQQVRVVKGETIVTWYIGKHFELEHSLTTGTVNARHFISDVAIVDTYNNRVPQIAYTHRDRLGSTVTMTDHNNTLQSMRHFDAFGKPRGGDWALLDPPQFPFNIADNRSDIRRGFTDHEHLDEAELIHMNGRVYDYNVGRFMSVDPVIQSPANSQSINPYSYIMNNPLAGTDPTGYRSEKEIEEPDEPDTNGQSSDGPESNGADNDSSGEKTTQPITDTNSAPKPNSPGNPPPDQPEITDIEEEKPEILNITGKKETGGSVSPFEILTVVGYITSSSSVVNPRVRFGVNAAKYGWGALIILTAGIPGSTPQNDPQNMRVSTGEQSANGDPNNEDPDDDFDEEDILSVKVEISRRGKPQITVTMKDGSVRVISRARTKIDLPEPRAAKGFRPKKFKNPLPGTKGKKRAPTDKEIKLLDKHTGG